MKKLVSLAAAAAMLVSAMPAFAADTAQEKVLAAVKDRIGSTERYERFDSSVSEDDFGNVYDFNWSTVKDGMYASMNVRADEKGRIIDYSVYDSESDYESKRTISSDDAMKKAKVLADKLNPELADKYVISKDSDFESLYDGDFYFNLQRMENGIPVDGDEGSISVDASAKTVKSYGINYTEGLKFAAADSIIDRAAAEKAYKEKLGMELAYKSYYDYKNRTMSIVPVYVPKEDSSKYINAVSGEVEEIRASDVIMYRNGAKDEKSMGAGSEDSAFTKAEQTELDNVKGLLSKTEIESKLKAMKYLNLANFKINSYSVRKGLFEEKYYANVYMEYKHGDENEYASFTLDAKTGRLIAANCYGRDLRSSKTEKNESELSAKAEEIANYFAADLMSEYKKDEDSKGANARYTRYVNDVPVTFDTIWVAIDSYTGELDSFRLSYTDMDFPSVDEVIGKDAAADKLFAKADYSAVYMQQASDEKLEKPDEFVIVYKFDEETPQTVDALSGEILDYSGKPYQKRVPAEYTDIDGHYAAAAIKNLAKYGISLDGDKFCPDNAIKQSDLLKLILMAFNHSVFDINDTTDDVYREARQSGVIKSGEENPDAQVTREQTAVFIVRALGIEEYANLEGIFVKPFADVNSNVGAISILTAMKVFGGDGSGNFNPTGAMTRGDAMIVINNYLSR